jgi:hypothetical protein
MYFLYNIYHRRMKNNGHLYIYIQQVFGKSHFLY